MRSRAPVGRLEDDGVAVGQRRRDLPRRDRDREIPRRDDADDADRLARDLDVDAGTHLGNLLAGRGAAPSPAKNSKIWPARADLADAFGQRLAFLARQQPLPSSSFELEPSARSRRGRRRAAITSQRRTSSMPKPSSNSRMNGPIAHEALLSLALPSSSALRPSKSRRLTSLPSEAPTCAAAVDRQHDLGLGLFHSTWDGCRPRRPCRPPTSAATW
jgi:hypothetical protein